MNCGSQHVIYTLLYMNTRINDTCLLKKIKVLKNLKYYTVLL